MAQIVIGHSLSLILLVSARAWVVLCVCVCVVMCICLGLGLGLGAARREPRAKVKGGSLKVFWGADLNFEKETESAFNRAAPSPR